MRRLLLALFVSSLVACKKDKPQPASAAPAKCTMAFLSVADPERCETACFGGDAEACAVASSQFLGGRQARLDPGRALSQAAKGCDLGSALSCANVAAVLSGQYDGRRPDGGVYANEEQLAVYEGNALRAAERECGAGRFESCSLAAYAVGRPRGGARAPDEAKAVELAKRGVTLMEQACEAKDGFACAQLAMSYGVIGLAPERNAAKADELNAKACELGHAEACREVPPGATEAERLRRLQRGCELGSGSVCGEWAVELGGADAEPALRRACELRDGLSCHQLARRSKGEDAQKLLERACAVGYEPACAP